MSSVVTKVLNFWIKTFAPANSCIKGKHQYRKIYECYRNYRDSLSRTYYKCLHCEAKGEQDTLSSNYFFENIEEFYLESYDYVISFDLVTGEPTNTKQDYLCSKGIHIWKEVNKTTFRDTYTTIYNIECENCKIKAYKEGHWGREVIGKFYDQ